MLFPKSWGYPAGSTRGVSHVCVVSRPMVTDEIAHLWRKIYIQLLGLTGIMVCREIIPIAGRKIQISEIF